MAPRCYAPRIGVRSEGARRGGGERFPTTRSAVLHMRSADPILRGRAFERLVLAYWKPVYKYVRVRWRRPEAAAADLTQGFFATALEKATFASYDPARSRFRTFVRGCLDHFVANDVRAEKALKRGGGVPDLRLDFASAEGELGPLAPQAADDVEGYFDAQWTRHLVDSSLETLRDELRAKGKDQHLLLLERYDLSGDELPSTSYAAMAAELGIKVADVTNRLAYARRQLRRIVLDKLREITASDEEFRGEVRDVLGVDL